ncbi:MAG TPA: hypothetical protein VGF13_02455 [Verrucomicrobiae bacterium]|jgi:hypothetical protein
MPFAPTKPANGTQVNSLELRHQLNALKALIDAVQAQVNGLLPVGFIGAWPKSLANMPALPGTWVECNGQVLNEPGSPFDGQTIEDLNGVAGPRRFLRGATASGGTGGAQEHTHGLPQFQPTLGDGGSTDQYNILTSPLTDPASSLPSYYEVVWVMRVQ